MSKWFALIIIHGQILFCTFTMYTLIGYVFMPRVESTSYFHIDEPIGMLDSFIYNIEFYFIVLFVHIAWLSVISLFSVIVKKPLLVSLGTVALLVSCIYVFKPIQKIIFNTDVIAFSILGGVYDLNQGLLFLLMILVFFSMSLWIWNKRIGDIV
ncbi:hypothetical protein [Bacillus gaemokensis]|nr:hypothetical protein [Bacillus gaemokensis]